MFDFLKRCLFNMDGTGAIADNDQAARDAIGDDEAQVMAVGGSDGMNIKPLPIDPVTGNLKTTASISGDVNVDNNSVDTSGYIGKPSGTNGDFTTAYASATTITLSSFPTGITAITANDIVAIVHLNATGAVVGTYTRDDVTITAAGADPTTLTITGGTAFGATDVFVVYTNIQRNIFGGDIAESTVPVEVADAAIVARWVNTFGQAVDHGANLSEGTQDVSMRRSPDLQPPTQATLTAPGDGSIQNVGGMIYHTWQVVIASIDTTVDIRIDGVLDDADDGNVEDSNPPAETQFLANGTYFLRTEGAWKYQTPVFAGEDGGVGATVTFAYRGSRNG